MSAFSCACNLTGLYIWAWLIRVEQMHDRVCSVISLCFWREELDLSVIWFKDIASLCLLEGSVLTHRLFQIKELSHLKSKSMWRAKDTRPGYTWANLTNTVLIGLTPGHAAQACFFFCHCIKIVYSTDGRCFRHEFEEEELLCLRPETPRNKTRGSVFVSCQAWWTSYPQSLLHYVFKSTLLSPALLCSCEQTHCL